MFAKNIKLYTFTFSRYLGLELVIREGKPSGLLSSRVVSDIQKYACSLGY